MTHRKLLPAHLHTSSVCSSINSDDRDRRQVLGAAVYRPHLHHPDPCTSAAWMPHRQEHARLPVTPEGKGVLGNPTAVIHNLNTMQATCITHTYCIQEHTIQLNSVLYSLICRGIYNDSVVVEIGIQLVSSIWENAKLYSL